MAEQEKDQHLDEMLDSLLASYSNEDPRPGMETRILVALEAHAKQRRRTWVLGFAMAAAVVLLALAITNVRTAKPGITAKVDVRQPSTDAGPAISKKSAPVPGTANTRHVHQRGVNPDKDEINKAILQMSSLGHGDFPADAIPFEPEKLSPGLTRRQEPEPAIVQLPPAPRISIRDLGVQQIEIKELTPAKDIDGKGN